jgi:methionine-rich copper-binding protein CopC
VVLTQEENAIDIDFKPITAAAASFSVEVPTLSTGTYTVSWTALGGDSHRVNGSFSFGVGAAAEEHAGHGGEHVGHAQHNNSHSSH